MSHPPDVGGDTMEYKSSPSYTKDVDGRTVVGLASIFGIVDDGGDVVHKGAFKRTISHRATASNRKRVRHLWQHDGMRPPIAHISNLQEVGKDALPQELLADFPDATGGLEVTRSYLETQRAEEVLAGIKAGAINEMSFGFDPVKWNFEELDEGGQLLRHLKELRLWDTSDVLWGMNRATLGVKSALPFKDTGTADEGADWSKPTLGDFTEDSWDDLSDAEKRRIAAHYAWASQMPPESFGDLSLPHHLPGRSGVGKAVWRGVAAAMAALLGARGGVDIPDGDRKAVYNHLKKHYAQFDKEPPDYKLVELAGLVRLVKANAETLSKGLPRLSAVGFVDILGELEQSLRLDSPPDEVLTLKRIQALDARIAIAERELL